jgi:catechol 2,3-dioxygenase-like lactoylglutathione lyase family enzyme
MVKLDSVRVFVADLDAARPFYGDLLGLPLVADGSGHGYCVFQAGSVQLVVESVPATAPDDDRALVGRFTGLSFTVADAEATCRAWTAQGVRFTGLPERQFWGGILATFCDPSGNQLQIVQRPATAD